MRYSVNLLNEYGDKVVTVKVDAEDELEAQVKAIEKYYDKLATSAPIENPEKYS